MIAGFFGDRSTQRYFAYHEPTGSSGRSRAVLLCNPGPQEYRQCHFALKQLAERLAERGVHVLRFDYLATGDSSGRSADATLAQWTDDVEDAANELRELSGVSRLSLVGIRLGAAIAARAVMRGVRAQELVLWDPVVKGARYLAHLEAVHDRIRLDQAYPISDRAERDTLLGLEMSAALRAETVALDLLQESIDGTVRVAVFTAQADTDAEQLVSRYSAAGLTASLQVVPDATLARPVWHEDTLLARAIPLAIVAHLAGSGA